MKCAETLFFNNYKILIDSRDDAIAFTSKANAYGIIINNLPTRRDYPTQNKEIIDKIIEENKSIRLKTLICVNNITEAKLHRKMYEEAKILNMNSRILE